MFYSKGENRRKGWLYSVFRITRRQLAVFWVLLALVVAAVVSVAVSYQVRASDYDLAEVVRGGGASVLFDSANKPVANLTGDLPQPVTWQELPKHLVDAFVAREDDRFFDHGGVVFTAVVRSLLRNLSSMKYEQGASTITMQLTRNVFELQGKSLDRKLLEVALARRIESEYDKQTILCQYLSRIYFGQSRYGLRDAAAYYFAKDVKDLDLVESATLAGLVRGPSIFNPVADMDKAMVVKRETLDRMLEQEMISQEEHDAAVEAPIELHVGNAAEAPGSGSYPTMWVCRELDEIGADLLQGNRELSVVSNLDLDIQTYLERAVEAALTAVENPHEYPESWKALADTPEAAKAQQEAFAKMRRPINLRRRGMDNNMAGLLQCCALVVDSRRNHKGNVLALVGGRSAVDGVDRWARRAMPGRALAPLVFSCACVAGEQGTHIVSKDAVLTGRQIGYGVERAFFDSLELDADLPDQAHEADLYAGNFRLPMVDLARLLFDMQNLGRGYKLSLTNTVWSRARTALYAYEPEKAPEYIRRESAQAVASIPPFITQDDRSVVLNESLPGNGGQFVMVTRDKGVAVFVWMGFDNPKQDVAGTREMQRLLQRAASNLARDVFNQSRAVLRAKAKQQEP